MRSSITSSPLDRRVHHVQTDPLELPRFIKDAQIAIVSGDAQRGPKASEAFNILRSALESLNVHMASCDIFTDICVDFTQKKDVPNGYDVHISTRSERDKFMFKTTYVIDGKHLELFGLKYDLELKLFDVRVALGEF